MGDSSRPRSRLIAALFAIGLIITLCSCTQQRPTQAAQAGEPAVARPICGELSTVGEGADAISVIKLWGTPYEMGYAHGKLCSEKIKAFYGRIIGAMTVGMNVDPKVLDAAWAQMEPFVAEHHIEELKGLADGAGIDLQMVQRAHAVPDLSEFHCTFFAAFGQATKDGKLHQIRALDYEMRAGIQDEPALVVYKPEGHNAFVQVGWVGFIGCISGMNDKQIAVSEIGEHFSDDVETLAGEPMPLVMRRALEEANTLDEGIQVFKSAHRTSSYLYCVGDGKIPDARKLRTSKDFCEIYGPGEQGDATLPNVVYWSMGVDSRWNKRVHDVLKAKLGQIDENVGMQDIMGGLGTGNLHAVHYVPGDLELWVANATPAPENAPAYDQEFVHFSLAEALK